MANSPSNIDNVVQSQASKEVTINAYFDACSPSTLYGRRQSTSSGLTWGYYGGRYKTLAIANGTITLSASTTNYVEADTTTGVVSKNTTAWTGASKKRLYSVVTGASTVTSWQDFREAEASIIANTDALAEGSTNQYFTVARVRAVVLAGLSTATNAVITASDTVLTALGKLQKQISDNLVTLNSRTGDTGSIVFRNRLINGNFSINQLALSGTVTLAAGAYGHDGWKAGSSGCTYTFAASGIDTVITISAGSLLQIVENLKIEGGVYTLSNAGTSNARIAVSGAATSGAYAATPLASASAGAGQTVTVEFTTGTVSKVQLEQGTTASTFERRPYDFELRLCQRYYEVSSKATALVLANATNRANPTCGCDLKVEKMASPTLVLTSASTPTVGNVSGYSGGALYAISSIGGTDVKTFGTFIQTTTNMTSADMVVFSWTASSRL